MRLGLDKHLGIHDDALLLRSRRSEILASNLANADTPGYKARDMDFKEAIQSAKLSGQGDKSALAMNKTQQGHLDGQNLLPASWIKYRVPNQPAVDGNTVETQIEQAEFGKNSMYYMASLRFLNSKFSGLKAALKGQ